MRRNGWKTALPVFLLSATLSTAVLAAGGLGMGDLGRAVPDIAPVPYVSPFAVVDGVAVAAPPASAAAAEQPLVAFNRIPQPPSRAADTPPRPRPVMVAGETVPIDPPDAADEVRPRVRRPRGGDTDRDADRSRGRRDDDVAPDAAPAPQSPPADDKPGDKSPHGKPGETPKGEGDGQAPGKAARHPDDEGDKRVHTASADDDVDDDAKGGEDGDEDSKGRDAGDDGGDAKQSKDSKGSGGDDAKSRRN